MNFKGGVGISKALRITGKVGFSRPSDDRAFPLREGQHDAGSPKMTIPGPSMLHYRGGRKMMNMGVYPTWTRSTPMSAQAYGKAVRAFYDAGCRYLQLDDISLRLSLRSRAAPDAGATAATIPRDSPKSMPAWSGPR